ncbi:hypothetical protein EOD39_11527 [Acipenser ruthenus]|uniref:Uncharacterized protein n=1 Tax=Acipenser ruthenus TaxID=7906 RepID=A0A444UNL9_ACIRT|nr:hypothetical protein EOD39_11527 [Acipenser ruthenus]
MFQNMVIVEIQQQNISLMECAAGEAGLVELSPCTKTKGSVCVCPENSICLGVPPWECESCEDHEPCQPGTYTSQKGWLGSVILLAVVAMLVIIAAIAGTLCYLIRKQQHSDKEMKVNGNVYIYNGPVVNQASPSSDQRRDPSPPPSSDQRRDPSPPPSPSPEISQFRLPVQEERSAVPVQEQQGAPLQESGKEFHITIEETNSY